MVGIELTTLPTERALNIVYATLIDTSTSIWIASQEVREAIDKSFDSIPDFDEETWGETPEDQANLDAAMSIAAQVGD